MRPGSLEPEDGNLRAWFNDSPAAPLVVVLAMLGVWGLILLCALAIQAWVV